MTLTTSSLEQLERFRREFLEASRNPELGHEAVSACAARLRYALIAEANAAYAQWCEQEMAKEYERDMAAQYFQDRSRGWFLGLQSEGGKEQDG